MQRTLKRRAVFSLAAVAALVAGCGGGGDSPTSGDGNDSLPKLADFPFASECKDCHPDHYNEWSGSRHAHSFTDPVFFHFNKTSIEDDGQVNQTFCLQCHSPVGVVTGEVSGVVDPETVPERTRDGVGCEACHFMIDPGLDNEGTFGYLLEPGITQYGNLGEPVRNTFHLSEYRSFFEESSQCRNCHNFVSPNGPFEVTWTEWVGSFSAMRRECQECHMPAYQGEAAVGTGVTRTLHRHEFVGADLAYTADFPNRDRQRAAIDSLMKTAATLEIVSVEESAEGESLFVSLRVKCLTGHNLPSGVSFNRDVWIRIAALSGSDTIYASGLFDEDGNLDTPGGGTRDPDLKKFYALAANRTELGEITYDNTLKPLEEREIGYRFPMAGASGTVDLNVELLFRALSPAFLEGAGLSYLATDEFIPVFTIDADSTSIVLSGGG